MLGKKTMEAEILEEAVEISSRKMDCALTLVTGDDHEAGQRMSLRGALQLTARPLNRWSPKTRRSRLRTIELVAEIQQRGHELSYDNVAPGDCCRARESGRCPRST